MALRDLVLAASLCQVNPEWIPGAPGREQVACVKEKRLGQCQGEAWPGTSFQPPPLNPAQDSLLPALPPKANKKQLYTLDFCHR